ncbi:hypothetical protein NDU88_000135 [Pleurodeles waltl]|uniref:ADP-ribosylation factor-like protein 9 n=1 Tax=Pleurodeles waltl TaxID=8319 RepID=A0AAV7VV88_PLEWA|nr:hypothetical protein NDU88_000135 [Pleurodeles waltl]
MVDWRRVGVLTAAVAVTGGVFYVLWSYLSSRRRRKRQADEPLLQPQRQQAEADVNPKSPSQTVRQEEESGQNPQPPILLPAHVVQLQAEADETPQTSDVPQAQVVRQEAEAHLEEEMRKEEPRVEEPPPQLDESFLLPEHQVSTINEPPLQEKPSESKYVLVLGLDGAGKSSILNTLAASRAKHCATPTEGLNALCIATEDAKVEFLELGGNETLRSYWNMYLSKAHLLIFVVDSADHDRFPLAKQYLFEAIGINSSLPVMILANKQDLEDAFSITQIHEALSLSEIGDDRKLFLISTHVGQDGAEIPSGLQDAKELISQIVLNTFDSEAEEPAAKPANERKDL